MCYQLHTANIITVYWLYLSCIFIKNRKNFISYTNKFKPGTIFKVHYIIATIRLQNMV